MEIIKLCTRDAILKSFSKDDSNGDPKMLPLDLLECGAGKDRWSKVLTCSKTAARLV